MTSVVWHKGKISREDRCKLIGQKNKVLWFTGLSGSGKSTIAVRLEEELYKKNILCFILDGDNVRHGLNSNLGFSKKDRKENIRRVSEVAKLMYESGSFVLVSFISPFKKDREFAKNLIGEDFIEVFVDCPLKECKERDTKGMYEKAEKGIIKDFTGVSQEYEAPDAPDIVLKTAEMEPEKCVWKILEYLEN